MAKEGGTGDLPQQVAFIGLFSGPEQGYAISQIVADREYRIGAISSHCQNARIRLWIEDLKTSLEQR